MAENLGNDFSTTLSGAINSSITSLDVASATGSPAANFRIRIDDELMLVTSKGSGTDWTVTRGIEGTTAASHADAADVYHVVTKGGLDQYLAELVPTGYSARVVQSFSGDASDVTFTLSSAVDEVNTDVYISGVYQSKATYSISGTTLTFSTAPPLGTDNIEVVVMSQVSIEASNKVVDLFSGDGSDVTFTLSQDPGSKNNIGVYIHGLYQQKDTFEVSGTTLTFDTAPVAGTDNVEVVIGGTIPIATPADGSVTTAKMADEAVDASSLAQGVTVGGIIRQAVQSAYTDSSGYNAAFSAGTGLAVNLAATSEPMVLAFADGFGARGASDFISTLSADASSAVSGLSASNTSFLHATYVSPTSVTWGSCLVPPQDGYAFDRTQASLLNFEGADGSTTMLDDFGNTWTVAGNAQIDTAQFKFGASSLLLDGSGDSIETTDIQSFGDGSWDVSVWVRWNALPSAAGTDYVLSMAQVATGYGVLLYCTESGGTVTTRFHASSTGSTWDIANGVAGSTGMSAGVWYRIRIAFDALGGTYRVYVSNNGAAEVQQSSTASGARICKIDKVKLGNNFGGGNDFDGWIDAFRFVRAATATSAETPSASAPTVTDYPVHFYSIPKAKMYEVTAASVSAGANPTLTARKRLFVGEADTNGSGVTAVRNYALRGQYDSGLVATIPTTQTAVSFNHNIGTKRVEYDQYVECVSPGTSSFTVGQRTRWYAHQTGVGVSPAETHTMSRNTARYQTGYNDTYLLDATGGGWGSVNGSTSFKYGLSARRAY